MAANRIVVVGLGYVGLPLAVALARNFEVTGFDIDPNRIGELRENHDRTREIDEEALAGSTLQLTHSPHDCAGAGVYIVTVPTPVDEQTGPTSRPCWLPRGSSASGSTPKRDQRSSTKARSIPA